MIIEQLLILGVALGLNNALASVALGALKMPRAQQMKTALTFAFFEALMPLLGVVIGEDVAGLVGGHAKYIGVVILAALGIYSLFKADSKSDGGDEEANRKKGLVSTILLAVALSLDNLTVGFGLGFLKIPLALSALVFGFISLIMTLIGLEIGRYLGNRFTFSTDRISGIVLIATAGIMML